MNGFRNFTPHIVTPRSVRPLTAGRGAPSDSVMRRAASLPSATAFTISAGPRAMSPPAKTRACEVETPSFRVRIRPPGSVLRPEASSPLSAAGPDPIENTTASTRSLNSVPGTGLALAGANEPGRFHTVS